MNSDYGIKRPTIERIPVGVWAQWPLGARWSNEGMTRLLGFLIEGVAAKGVYVFRIVLPDWIRDEAETDLRSLSAQIGRDFSLHSPRDAHLDVSTMSDLVDFANQYVVVAGWLSIFPNFNYAADLEKPLAVIFPDAIPKVFHEFSDLAWGFNGNHAVWESYVREVLGRADRVVTFSKHVRDAQLTTLFGVDSAKVSVVPHAPPDLSSALPNFQPGERNPDTVALAAELLREHAAQRDWGYLRAYPFEQVPYVAVSTQDRVTKNIRLILDATMRLIRLARIDLKIFSTAPLHFGSNWTVLPTAIENALAHRDLVSVPDLPREQHAALFHCAAMAVHASIFEGGHGPFPFYEAVSVGTPCLMAAGPHVSELLEEEPTLGDFVFDPNDAEGLSGLMLQVLKDREQALATQRGAYERLRRRSWADVAGAYAEAAVAGPLAPVEIRTLRLGIEQ